MSNTIKIKNSNDTGAIPSSLQYGELAINSIDYKLFYKDNEGTIREKKMTNSLSFVISSTDIITTGNKLFTRLISNHKGKLIGWKIITDVNTSLTLDIWKSTTTPSNSNSICASAKPSITADYKNSSSTLTGWTTSVDIGDIFEIEVESNTAAKYINLILELK